MVVVVVVGSWYKVPGPSNLEGAQAGTAGGGGRFEAKVLWISRCPLLSTHDKAQNLDTYSRGWEGEAKTR